MDFSKDMLISNDHSSSSYISAILGLLFIGCVYVFIIQALFFITRLQLATLNDSNGTSPVHIDALEAALAEASTANKTLIIAIVNKAYVEGDKPMLDRYARKDNSTGQKKQDVLDRMMHEGVFRKLELRVRFLDTLYFSGFCQNIRDIRVVSTVHANCCRTISAKIAALTAVIQNWKMLKSSSAANVTSTFGRLNHAACRDSWKNS
ncbi:hypothetical protein P3X46_030748 [Hevea brasiliensis]|uniref:Nucleotide-diphospho-sugar transferase domain-containing protein n=1 Tax=Hevea brasiliensis TaxID=3981 RepID=A0ABQ9KI75_HEVBR|nr:hypothetical protein P3X46_030748 [Hevea brasiliensis]